MRSLLGCTEFGFLLCGPSWGPMHYMVSQVQSLLGSPSPSPPALVAPHLAPLTLVGPHLAPPALVAPHLAPPALVALHQCIRIPLIKCFQGYTTGVGFFWCGPSWGALNLGLSHVIPPGVHLIWVFLVRVLPRGQCIWVPRMQVQACTTEFGIL